MGIWRANKILTFGYPFLDNWTDKTTITDNCYSQDKLEAYQELKKEFNKGGSVRINEDWFNFIILKLPKNEPYNFAMLAKLAIAFLFKHCNHDISKVITYYENNTNDIKHTFKDGDQTISIRKYYAIILNKELTIAKLLKAALYLLNNNQDMLKNLSRQALSDPGYKIFIKTNLIAPIYNTIKPPRSIKIKKAKNIKQIKDISRKVNHYLMKNHKVYYCQLKVNKYYFDELKSTMDEITYSSYFGGEFYQGVSKHRKVMLNIRFNIVRPIIGILCEIINSVNTDKFKYFMKEINKYSFASVYKETCSISVPRPLVNALRAELFFKKGHDDIALYLTLFGKYMNEWYEKNNQGGYLKYEAMDKMWRKNGEGLYFIYNENFDKYTRWQKLPAIEEKKVIEKVMKCSM